VKACKASDAPSIAEKIKRTNRELELSGVVVREISINALLSRILTFQASLQRVEMGTAKFEPEKPDSIAKFTPITFAAGIEYWPPDPPEVVCAS